MIPPNEKWRGQAEMLVNRVKKNQRRLKSWLLRNRVSCFRLYNLDIPEIPLLVDWYEERLHVGVKLRGESDGEEENRWVRYLVNALAGFLGLPENAVFIKFRRQGRGGTQYAPLAADARIYEVTEGGHRFTVNLSDYLDTGLFLDHRQTRQMVEKEAAGKRFLNLFAYTGAFTVYAAAGGAVATTTIDLSNTYLKAAQHNMAINGFSGGTHRYQKHDVLALLERGNWGEMYDLVVMDAPTVSVSKSMTRRLAIQQDYAWMLNGVLNHVSEGGVVYFSCNLASFRFEPERVMASAVEEITGRTIPPDFAGKPPHCCFRLVK
jgi:23S rRNA G2069 N7-methylase RlmK/C1962 C5-methylase RlmI